MVLVGEGTRPNGPSHPCENSRKLSGKIDKVALMAQKYMATIKQIEANRLNALKSTGPKTPEGKAAVRMNALRHGLRARTVVLPGENPDDFQQLCDDLETEWNPESRTEQFYVEQMAVSQWKLTRIELAEKSIVTQEATAKIQIPLLERLWQSQCRLERSYARAQRELERLQKSRLPVPPKGKASEQPERRPSILVTWHPEKPEWPSILLPGDPDPLDETADSGAPKEGDPQKV